MRHDRGVFGPDTLCSMRTKCFTNICLRHCHFENTGLVDMPQSVVHLTDVGAV